MRQSAIGLPVVVFIAALAFAVPVQAASSTAEMGVGRQRMSEIIQDMASELLRLSNQLGKGDLDSDAQKALARRTHEMFEMMQTMSGMLCQGMTMDQHMRQQMDQTRRQLDEMMSSGAAGRQK